MTIERNDFQPPPPPPEEPQEPQETAKLLKRSKWQKSCPYCMEKIPSDARKCRYCGELLEEPGARRKYAAPPPPSKMSGCLIAVIVCVAVVPFIAIIAAIAIPNLLESKKAANEAAAIQSLRIISSAEELFYTRYNRYATLSELQEALMIDSILGNASQNGMPKSGFYFNLKLTPAGWSCTAVPSEPGTTGERSFYIDQTGVITYEIYQSSYDEPANEKSNSLGW